MHHLGSSQYSNPHSYDREREGVQKGDRSPKIRVEKRKRENEVLKVATKRIFIRQEEPSWNEQDLDRRTKGVINEEISSYYQDERHSDRRSQRVIRETSSLYYQNERNLDRREKGSIKEERTSHYQDERHSNRRSTRIIREKSSFYYKDGRDLDQDKERIEKQPPLCCDEEIIKQHPQLYLDPEKTMINIQALDSIDQLDVDGVSKVINQILNGSIEAGTSIYVEVTRTTLLTKAIKALKGSKITPKLLTILLTKRNEEEHYLWDFQKKLFERAGNELLSPQACAKMFSRAKYLRDFPSINEVFNRACSENQTNCIIYILYINAIVKTMKNPFPEIKRTFRLALEGEKIEGKNNQVNEELLELYIQEAINESGDDVDQILKEAMEKAHAFGCLNKSIFNTILRFSLERAKYDLTLYVVDYAISVKHANFLSKEIFIENIYRLEPAQQRDLFKIYVTAVYREKYVSLADELFDSLNLMPEVDHKGIMNLSSYSPELCSLIFKRLANPQKYPDEVPVRFSHIQFKKLFESI